MAQIKVTYFPGKGRAEPVRLALHVGGIEFEDERLGVEAIKVRKGAGALQLHFLPTMTVDDDVYAESGAMLRYAGKLSGLYLKCDKAAMKLDMIRDVLETVILENSKKIPRRVAKSSSRKWLRSTLVP